MRYPLTDRLLSSENISSHAPEYPLKVIAKILMKSELRRHSMRDFIIITVLCFTAAYVADAVWLHGKYFGAVKQKLGFSWSPVNHR